MNVMRSEEREELPPLLRKEIFSDQGSTIWFNGSRSRKPIAAWLLVLSSAVAIAVLITMSMIMTHRQVHWHKGTFQSTALVCPQEGKDCRVSVRTLLGGKDGGSMFVPGTALEVDVGAASPLRSRILAQYTDGESAMLDISWPRGTAVPTGAVTFGTVKLMPLINWIAPRYAAKARTGDSQ